MEENAREFPEKEYRIEHVFEDGEYVIVHGLVTLKSDKQFMVVHILKFQNGKIIEMWDIGQEVPN
jgi:predicted SnoaL-like aldol condensation-catalyzing enzyme